MNMLDSMENSTPTGAYLSLLRSMRLRISSATNGGAQRSTSFSIMVRKAKQDQILTDTQADSLLEFGDLRNAISHGRYDQQGNPIAEPNVSTVEAITKIRDSLINPVTALQILGERRVRVYAFTDTIGELIAAPHGKYPVYSEGKFTKLFVDSDIVAWMNNRTRSAPQKNQVLLKLNMPVAELDKVAPAARCAFVGRQASPAAVISAMTTPRRGHFPRAVIINKSGQPNQKPLQIVTGTELALLVEKCN